MKGLWAYIKERDLQNPQNKKVILVSKDEKLHGVLGVDKCEGFSMSKCAAPIICMIACKLVVDVAAGSGISISMCVWLMARGPCQS